MNGRKGTAGERECDRAKSHAFSIRGVHVGKTRTEPRVELARGHRGNANQNKGRNQTRGTRQPHRTWAHANRRGADETMERGEALLDDMSTQQHQQPASHTPQPQWQPAAAAAAAAALHLQPGHLPIARVQRAWERQPRSPLTRTKIRVGKVWKRPAAIAPQLPPLQGAFARGDGTPGRRRFETEAAASPMRAVKKVCLDFGGVGMGARVSRWEGRGKGSPLRKIVTRAGAAAAKEELVELSGEEESTEEESTEEEERHVTVDIVDEEGNVLESGDAVEEEGWEDVEEERVMDDAALQDGEEAHGTEVEHTSAEGSHQYSSHQDGSAAEALPEIQHQEREMMPANDGLPASEDEELQGTPIACATSQTPDRLRLPPTPSISPAPILPQSSPVQERASSAPPEEEPRPLSPEKTFKPRLSDDTALLQAFLNRAAENKTSRRMSVTQRESISNRRDSDTVRQALASPAKSLAADNVLGELDPNSPSPRKSIVGLAGAQLASPLPDRTAASTPAEDKIQDPIEDPEPAPRTRRSVRDRKKPQTLSQARYSGTTAAAPSTKITIRGPANGVDVKKTQVQELALLTRNNTRKNKAGCVLPKLRLTKMAAEIPSQGEGEGEGEVEVQAEGTTVEASVETKAGKKGVQWAETLTSFYEGGQDFSQLSDDGVTEERLPWERPALPDDSDEEDGGKALEEKVVVAAPAPADTPSKPKPKIRRLKAPRTAATPGRAPVAAIEATAEDEKVEDEAKKPAKKTASKLKRSRIATPAKSPSASATNSLLPLELLPASTAPTTTRTKRAAAPTTTRRRVISKLPALSTSANAPPTLSASLSFTQSTQTSHGKENNVSTLTASPAKKKAGLVPVVGAGAGVPTAKAFAPRLDFDFGVQAPPPGRSSDSSNNGGAEQSEPPAPAFGLTSSPAKKGLRGRPAFTPTAHGDEEAVPGLKSPAKKRGGRKAAGMV
jgi:hypothetical protein